MTNDSVNSNANSINPLQVTNNDLLSTKLVTNVFDGTGFNGWRRGMEIALSAKNKLGFIDGSIAQPAASADNYKLWKQCNDIVFTWILSSLSPEIAQSVLYSSTAKIAWDELENRFGQSNGAQLYGIQKKLVDFGQGNDSISAYFTKMKLIWDEIDAMGLNPGCSCSCSCGAATKREKFQQDQRTVQFLMGLNKSYATVRGTILLQTPLPSLATVYNNLLQEERQREIQQEVQTLADSAAFYARNFQNKGSNKYYNKSPQQQGNFYNKSSPFQQQAINSYNRQPQFNPQPQPPSNEQEELKFCNYCKKPGHTIRFCKKLEFNNNKKKFANVVQNDGSGSCFNDFNGWAPTEQGVDFQQFKNASSSHSGASSSNPADITPEMLMQLKNIMQNSQATAQPSVNSAANFAGLFYEDASNPW